VDSEANSEYSFVFGVCFFSIWKTEVLLCMIGSVDCSGSVFPRNSGWSVGVGHGAAEGTSTKEFLANETFWTRS